MHISSYKIAWVTLVVILIFIPLMIFRYFSGSHTEYCPFSHKMSDTSQCLILHITPDRVLIRHSDKYTNEDYFEIIEADGSRRYDVPEYDGPVAKIYRIRMVDDAKNTVSINGREYVLLPIDEAVN